MKTKFILGILMALVAGFLIAWSVRAANETAPAQVAQGATTQAPAQAVQKPAVTSSMNMAKAMSQAFVDVSRKVTPSIVMIVNEEKLENTLGDDSQGFGGGGGDDFFQRFFNFSPQQREQIQRTLGSGVIISPDGYIVTNNHVVNASTKLMVTLPDGKRVPGKIIGTDPKTDLALVKVQASGLQPITLGKYSDIEVGEWVLAFGSPFGEAMQHSVTAGIISAKGRSNVGIADYEDFLQTDAAINPGNSGGALVDLDGNLIGINTAILSASGSNAGVGLAIPISMVQTVINQLKTNGRVVRGYMGVTIQDLNDEMKRSMKLQNYDGAVISNVEKGSPAEQAGLKPYDVIISVNGHRVKNNTEVRDLVASLKPNTDAELGIVRDGKEQTVTVKVQEMKADQNAPGSNKEDQEKLGMELQNLSPSLSRQLGTDRTRGVVVTNVTSGSVAEEAGLQQGDIIFEVNRQQVTSVRDLKNIISSTKDDSVLLAIERQGQTFFVTLQLH
jgi:serine protease Do